MEAGAFSVRFSAMSDLPLGAAYHGATAEALELARKEAGDAYLPSVFNPGTLSKKGPLRVAKDRISAKYSADGKPGFDIYYELHGTGPKRISLLMGLNNSCFGWLDQVEEFGADPEYSVLVIDNRGYGNSQAPYMRYTTSEFAKDVLEVYEEIGWTQDKSVNLVGVSMGGMIALELSRMCPERFHSLLLLSTTAGERHNLPPYLGVRAIAISMTEQILGFGKPSDRVYRIIDVLFPPEWQDAKSERDPSRTNREVVRPQFMWRFGFARRPHPHGAISQIAAGLTHRVSEKDLAKIDQTIPKIRILTGDWDNLVDPSHSKYMKSKMPHAQYELWPGAGHAIHVQYAKRFNAMLREFTQ